MCSARFVRARRQLVTRYPCRACLQAYMAPSTRLPLDIFQLHISTMSVHQLTTSLGALRDRAKKAAQTTRGCASVTSASHALRVASIQPNPHVISSKASSSTDSVAKWQSSSGALTSETQDIVRNMVGDLWIATYLMGFALNMAAATAAAPLDELSVAHYERASQLVTLVTVLAESLQKRAATVSTKAAWLLAKGDIYITHLQEEHLPAMMADIDANEAQSRTSEVAAAGYKAACLALTVPAVIFACFAAAAIHGMPTISRWIHSITWVYTTKIENGEFRGRVVPSHDVPRPAASSLLLDCSAIALPALLCLVIFCVVGNFLAGTVTTEVMVDADKRARELQLEHNRQSRALQRLANDDMPSLRAMLKVMDPASVGMHGNQDADLLSTELCYLIADIRQALDDRGRLLVDSAITAQARLELNDKLLEVRSLLASSAARWSATVVATTAGLVQAPFEMHDAEAPEHDVTADLLTSFLESNSQQLAERLDLRTTQEVVALLGYVKHSTCTPEQLLKGLDEGCRPGLATNEFGNVESAASSE